MDSIRSPVNGMDEIPSRRQRPSLRDCQRPLFSRLGAALAAAATDAPDYGERGGGLADAGDRAPDARLAALFAPRRHAKDAGGRRREAAMSKLYCTEMANRGVRLLVEIVWRGRLTDNHERGTGGPGRA